MPNEPTLGEVMRGLQQMREEQRDFRQEVSARLDKLVTTEAFVAEQRRVDERIAVVAQDIADERVAREKGLAGTEKNIGNVQRANEETERKRGQNFRFTITTVITMAAVFVAIAGLVLSRGAA